MVREEDDGGEGLGAQPLPPPPPARQVLQPHHGTTAARLGEGLFRQALRGELSVVQSIALNRRLIGHQQSIEFLELTPNPQFPSI